MSIKSDEITSKRYRSILFVPANRPDRYHKAINSGADVVVVDLEDAVALNDKDSARVSAPEFFNVNSESSTQRALRINPCASTHGLKDLNLFLSLETTPDLVLLPKVEQKSDVEWLSNLLDDASIDTDIMALIESPMGLENAIQIASAPRVKAIVFGTADYSAELGCDMSWEPMLYGRGRVAQAAGANGIAAIDGAWLDYDDEQGLINEIQKSASLGFVGKPAIHPKQIQIIHDSLKASPDEILKAQKIIDAYSKANGGVVTVDGRMIDAPVVERARLLLTNNPSID